MALKVLVAIEGIEKLTYKYALEIIESQGMENPGDFSTTLEDVKTSLGNS